MIDRLKYATISQICTKNLIFYNPGNIEESLKFCTNLGITFLPDEKRQKFYKLVGNAFIEQRLIQSVQCNPYDLIFSKETLGKFKQDKDNTDNVLFVTENNKIKGVIHIVDYNKDFIFYEFYKLLFSYEKMLRDFLVAKKEGNESFLAFIKYKSDEEKVSVPKENWYFTPRHKEYLGKNERHKAKKVKERSTLGPFQCFYLSDLITFSNSKNFFINGINEVALCRLRNKIAHFRDIIKQDKDENAGRLYNFKGLSSFIDDALSFFNDYEILEEMLIDARSKEPCT